MRIFQLWSMDQPLKLSLLINSSQLNFSNFVDLLNQLFVAECLQNKNLISLNITWSQRKVFAFQLEMEQTMFQWLCRLILELVFEVWRVLKLFDLQILLSMSFKVWRNCCWFMDDGVIREFHGWFVIIFTKILCLLFQKFTLHFIMDIQVKFYSWTGFQHFITQFSHHTLVFSHFHLNRTQQLKIHTNIQFYIVRVKNTSTLT